MSPLACVTYAALFSTIAFRWRISQACQAFKRKNQWRRSFYTPCSSHPSSYSKMHLFRESRFFPIVDQWWTIAPMVGMEWSKPALPGQRGAPQQRLDWCPGVSAGPGAAALAAGPHPPVCVQASRDVTSSGQFYPNDHNCAYQVNGNF